MTSSSFHDFVMGDVLGHISDLRSRKMFGGWGLYKEGKIFGIIAEGILYFKVHEGNREVFEKAGSKPFTYENRGKKYAMSYWEVPEKVMNDRKKVEEWLQHSLEAGDKTKKSAGKKIVYRKAVLKDLVQMRRLQKQLNEARAHQFVKETKAFHERRKAPTLLDEADLQRDLFIIAEVAGTVVGYAWGQLAERSSSKLSKLGYLEEVCVDEGQRGKGVAKALLEQLVALFREHGCDHMTTHTDAENTAAQALYRSFEMIPVTFELWKKL